MIFPAKAVKLFFFSLTTGHRDESLLSQQSRCSLAATMSTSHHPAAQDMAALLMHSDTGISRDAAAKWDSAVGFD